MAPTTGSRLSAKTEAELERALKQPAYYDYFYDALDTDYRVRIPTVAQFYPDTWRYFRVERVRVSLAHLIMTGRVRTR